MFDNINVGDTVYFHYSRAQRNCKLTVTKVTKGFIFAGTEGSAVDKFNRKTGLMVGGGNKYITTEKE
jgi:hypothetical protein